MSITKKDLGLNNVVKCARKVYGGNLEIDFHGHDNLVIIEEECKLKKRNKIFIQGSKNIVHLHKNVTFDQNVLLVACEGTKIFFGEDCIVANGVTVRTSDQHAIYNSEGIRINSAKDVHIGNHVWLGAGAIVMKGTTIGDGSVIGMASMVTKDIPSNCIAVGIPAKVIKHDISWNEHLSK